MCFVSCSRVTDSQTTDDTASGSVSVDSAKIRISQLLKTMSPSVKVLAVVQNVGSSSADNLVCTVKPRKAAVVLEEHTVSFNAVLEPNEETWVEVEFSTVASHSAYDDIVFNFSWDESKSGSIAVSKVVVK